MQTSSDKIVKVAIKAKNEALLFKLDQDQPLENVIREVCMHCKIGYEVYKYSLQLLLSNSSPEQYMYITENNRDKIKNGSELKLIFSPLLLARKIKEKLSSKTPENLTWALEKAAATTTDFTFCEVFMGVGHLELQTLLKEFNLTNHLYIYSLQIILNLVKSSHLKNLDEELILQLKSIITSDHIINDGIIERSFKIMEAIILVNGDSDVITKYLCLDEFVHHIWNRGSTSIQGSVLALINAMVLKCIRAKTQRSILKQMNSTKLKENIYSNVMVPDSPVPPLLASSLNVYQSLILTLEKERYNKKIKSESLLRRLVPCLQSEEIIDSNAKNEIETELFGMSKDSENILTIKIPKIRNNFTSSVSASGSTLFESDEDEEQDIDDIVFTPETFHHETSKDNDLSQLTFECVIYLYNNHREDYKIALFDDGNNYSKFLTTCGRVIDMICIKVLRIGEIPENGETSFCPLIFVSATPFLEELFSKAISILQKTKRDMRARSACDLDKVFQVLQQQIVKALASRPIKYDQLDTALGEHSYHKVRSQWEEEQEERERHTLTNSPAINQLKQSLMEDTKAVIKKQRLQWIKNKTEFPVWNSLKNERVKNKTWCAFLSPDEKVIQYYEEKGDVKQLPVQSITALLTGRNCPHIRYLKSKDSKASKRELAFSLVTDQQLTVDFIADTQEKYDHWTDAINVLIGNEMKSTSMKRDLNILLQMELKLYLLDVDGIELPLEAPPVPLDPPNYEFYYLNK